MRISNAIARSGRTARAVDIGRILTAASAASQHSGGGGDTQGSDAGRFGNGGEGAGQVGVELNARARNRLGRERPAVILGEFHQVDEIDVAVIGEVAG